MNVSIRRASFGDRYAATSKFFTSPAICVVKADASKRVILVIPDFPARMLAHASATVLPTGQMIPKPVMTTRRWLTVDSRTGWGDRGERGRRGNQDLLCDET